MGKPTRWSRPGCQGALSSHWAWMSCIGGAVGSSPFFVATVSAPSGMGEIDTIVTVAGIPCWLLALAHPVPGPGASTQPGVISCRGVRLSHGGGWFTFRLASGPCVTPHHRMENLG